MVAGLVLGGGARGNIFLTAGNGGHGTAEAAEISFGSRWGFRRTSVGIDPKASQNKLTIEYYETTQKYYETTHNIFCVVS